MIPKRLQTYYYFDPQGEIQEKPWNYTLEDLARAQNKNLYFTREDIENAKKKKDNS